MNQKNNTMSTIKTVEDFKKFVGNDGKFFSVKFLKKDWSERSMVCRLGVKKGLTGRGMGYNPESLNNIVVFSVSDNGYRTINIDRLLRVKANGVSLAV